jgi:hypothetical protein
VQAKVWCGAGAKQTKQGFGLSYNQKFGAVVGAVRVYLTSKLWLGAWLGAKRKDKKQEVRSKDNKLKLGYTLYHSFSKLPQTPLQAFFVRYGLFVA